MDSGLTFLEWLAAAELIWWFWAPVLLPVVVEGALAFRTRRRGHLPPRLVSGARVLPIFLWGFLASCQTLSYLASMSAYCSWTPPLSLPSSFLSIAFALCWVCSVQTLAIALRGEPAASLGLRGWPRFLTTLMILTVLADNWALMAVSVPY